MGSFPDENRRTQVVLAEPRLMRSNSSDGNCIGLGGRAAAVRRLFGPRDHAPGYSGLRGRRRTPSAARYGAACGSRRRGRWRRRPIRMPSMRADSSSGQGESGSHSLGFAAELVLGEPHHPPLVRRAHAVEEVGTRAARMHFWRKSVTLQCHGDPIGVAPPRPELMKIVVASRHSLNSRAGSRPP